MKKVKILLLVFCIAFTFAGCNSFRLATSIDDLISPVSPSGVDADVQNAVDEYCKGGYIIKNPSRGEYTTSYIFYDLDGDGNDEALAFYEPSQALGTINMAVLNKNEKSWSVIENIKGKGSDVSCVNFSDVNNDGSVEIIVCWSLISKSTSSSLEIYRQQSTDKGFKLKSLNSSVTAGEFICIDINEDGTDEVLVFKNGSSSPMAELYSFKNNKKSLLGETRLDSSIQSFSQITVGRTDEGVSVYADALRSDGDSMVTELIYWSDYYNSIVSPFYSYNTGRTADTTRKSVINSKDINGDSVVEIPLDKNIKGLPPQLSAQSWAAYKNTVLNHKCYTVSCKRDSYSLLFNAKQLKSYSFKYDNDLRRLTVMNGKQQCFEIQTLIRSAYNQKDYAEYTQIFSNSGFVYLAKLDDKANITIDDLKNMIKPY